MLCPHCGKEIGETITINAVVPNVNNGCNPIPINTFVPFAANGCNPVTWLPDRGMLNLNAGAAPNPIVINFQV